MYGTAGFMSALTIKTALPKLDVQLVHSSEIGVIGVGESTTLSLVLHLHKYLGAEPSEFYREVNPVIKRGIRFLWGQRPWFDYSFSFQFDVLYAGLPKIAGYYVVGGDNQDVGQGTGVGCRATRRSRAAVTRFGGQQILRISPGISRSSRWLEKKRAGSA